MSACPCGYHGSDQKPCTCAAAVVTKYQKRISGPLLDRIDIHIEVPRVDYEKLSGDRSAEPNSRGRDEEGSAGDHASRTLPPGSWLSGAVRIPFGRRQRGGLLYEMVTSRPGGSCAAARGEYERARISALISGSYAQRHTTGIVGQRGCSRPGPCNQLLLANLHGWHIMRSISQYLYRFYRSNVLAVHRWN
jgi:hypothetical protein